jgi:hypothetical protein
MEWKHLLLIRDILPFKEELAPRAGVKIRAETRHLSPGLPKIAEHVLIERSDAVNWCISVYQGIVRGFEKDRLSHQCQTVSRLTM